MTVVLPDPMDILNILGVENVSHIEAVPGGSDTTIWKVTHGGQISALRLFRVEQADAARREAIAMSAAQGVAPVPQLRREGSWHARPALLLEWMRGVPLRDRLLGSPASAYDVGVAFGAGQGQIPTVEAPP